MIKEFNRWGVFVLGGWMTALSVSGSASADLLTESDSGVDGVSYSEIEKQNLDLAKHFPGWVEVMVYGKTGQGRNLTALKIQDPGFLKALFDSKGEGADLFSVRSSVLITGSTHGNEYLRIEDQLAPLFLNTAVQDANSSFGRFLRAGGILWVVPIFNPDGYELKQRENAAGSDLNRDYPIQSKGHVGFQQIETRSFGQWLERELASSNSQLLISLDYHCCADGLLYPWSYRGAPQLPVEREKIFVAIGEMAKNIFGSNFKYGQTPKVLGYSALGTSKDYFYERYGTTSFTFEGVYQEEPKRLQQHFDLWSQIMEYLLRQP